MTGANVAEYKDGGGSFGHVVSGYCLMVGLFYEA